MPDHNGYPTEAELQTIREWEPPEGGHFDFRGLLEVVRELWWMPDTGWQVFELPKGAYYVISTLGWSGNEELIDELLDWNNGLFWSLCWQWSRRGGHYGFLVKKPEES